MIDWKKLAIHDTATLRGYLKISTNVGVVSLSSTFSVRPPRCGKSTFSPSNPVDRFHRPLVLPFLISQRGDSRIQKRNNSDSSAGARPIRNNPLQPITGVRKAADRLPSKVPAGISAVTIPPITPR